MKMFNILSRIVMCGFLLWGTHLTARAQFNPDNPPEPQQMYKVIVEAIPAEAAWNSGGGHFVKGEQTYISTSSQSTNYQFDYWTKNGERFLGDDQQYFYHTVNAEKVTFVAHYKYRPEDPKEPTLLEKHHLYVQSQPQGCCSFNVTNGERYITGDYLYLDAYTSQGYQFLGWYEGANKVSDYTSFSYEMPSRDVTLVAKFRYSPVNPGEPNADPNKPQDDVQNQGRGDLNGDGSVTVSDAVTLVNAYLAGNAQNYPLGIYDVNQDGSISISDAVKIVNIYLGLE